MPLTQVMYEGETDPIVFPLTEDGRPFDLTGVDHVALILSGWDGRLQAAVLSGAAVTIAHVARGWVKWAPASTDLDARYSPYRLYFRLYNDDGTYLAAPRGDYYLLQVAPDLT